MHNNSQQQQHQQQQGLPLTFDWGSAFGVGGGDDYGGGNDGEQAFGGGGSSSSGNLKCKLKLMITVAPFAPLFLESWHSVLLSFISLLSYFSLLNHLHKLLPTVYARRRCG